MNTLFDLDALPTKPEPTPTAKPVTRYYVYGEFDGRQFVYWKGHDNGEPEGYFLDEYPRRVPHLYKTLQGAKRFADSNTKGGKVGVWEVKA